MSASDSVIPVLLLILVAVGVLSLVLALRHRLAFRVGMRNVRRSRSRTVLLILGLLVATTIISGSLIVGDTINELGLHYTLLGAGFNDEIVSNVTPIGSLAPFPYAVYSQVLSSASGDHAIAGIAPEIVSTVEVFDRSSGVPQPNLNFIGVNGNQSQQLGSFVTDGGQSLAGPAPGEVLLDDLAASELNASAGDSLQLYGANSTPVTAVVQAVVQDNVRGAFPTGGIGNFGSVFTDLATSQKVENLPGQINVLSVTNAGSQQGGVGLSDSVSANLNATLAKIPAASGLKVQETLKNGLATAQTSGSGISTLFLVLGLFSIVAGAMLIIGIFVLLAEERKGEMGMLRAIGLRRRELVYSYYFEGLAYSAGSALAGSVVGVGVGYGLTYAFSILFPAPGLSSRAILDSFTVLPQTLLIAYVIGFLLTLVTVVVASRRASRLNIVRAIRDIPEPPPAIRVYTYLAYLGLTLTALGTLLFLSTYRGSTDISEPLIGGAMMILGAALVASRFVTNRIAFSAAGAGFVVWAGFEPLHTALLGSYHTGGIFIVFVEGIIMVGGALFLFAFNSSSLVGGLLRLANGRSGRAPVARVALSYPGRRPTRTTITLAIFALVVFTLVAIATFGGTIQANLDHTVAEQSGGFTFFGFSNEPIPDLPGQIAGNASLASQFSVVVPLYFGGANLNVSGFSANPFGDAVFAGPTGLNASSSFYTTNRFPFSTTLGGISAGLAMHELETNGSVAIVDQSYAVATTNLGGGGGTSAPHPSVAVGDSIRVANPVTGNSTTVRVIGILLESTVTGVWLNPATAFGLGFHEEKAFFLTTAAGVSGTHAAQLAKAAFFRSGLVLYNFQAILAQSIAGTEGAIGLLQIFVGLGLAVGIAAMGIVAVRAVVERRREIGMIRANGFTRRMVLRAFFLEYTFVSLLGIGIGTALGLLIVYNLSTSPSAAAAGVSTFSIPWLNLLLILLVAYGLAMAAVAEPSLRAARLPPAEAVRPTE
ncbi:MAG: FtsX-like permease family protein [Thermoplasmata archaeon]|nr:FtsX-like permease family protein [Thermoplasmata archaeon]